MRIPILLVDDNPSNLIGLESILRPEGYELHSAHSGKEAIRLCGLFDYGLILLDVHMPFMDGFETADEIRKSPRAKQTPIIFLSAVHDEQSYVLRAHLKGAVDYLFKPINVDVLRAKVKVFSDLYRSHTFQERLFRTLDVVLSTGPDHQYILDRNFKFQFANKSLLTLWGKSLEEIVGKGFKELGYPQDLIELHHKQLAEVISLGGPVSGENFYTNFEGKKRFYEYIFAPVKDANGFTEAIVGTTRDATEKHSAQNQRNQRSLENERENFRHLFRQTPEMVCILRGKDHRFEFVNEAHIKVLGFDATGLTVREAQPESVEVHGILDHVYETGITAHLHEIPVTVTGRLRYFNLTYSARRNEDNVIDGIMILGIEVTEQIQNREAQRVSQDQLSFALSSAGMGAWVVNLETGHVTLSEEAYSIFGFSKNYRNADDAIDTFIHPDDREHARKTFEAAVAANGIYEDEYRIKKPDGEIRWVKLQGRSISSSNTPSFFSGVVTDTTKDVEAQERLRAAVSMRDEFISTASHELKTPITSLSLQLQLLERISMKNPERPVDPEKLRNFIDVSRRQVNNLTNLISDMLDVTRLSAGQMVLNRQPIDLSLLLADVIERFRENAVSSGVDITTPDFPPLQINADPVRLEQVIVNLLTNALKYGDKKPITVTAEAYESGVQFSVKDFGIGIPADQLDDIFERFIRAVPADKISGLGLGLYISKKIVEAHHGDISVESSIGNGSLFTVKIPYQS